MSTSRNILVVGLVSAITSYASANFGSVVNEVIMPAIERCPGFIDGDAQIRLRPAGYNVWDGGRHNYHYECYLPASFSKNRKDEVVTGSGDVKTGSGENAPTAPSEPAGPCPGGSGGSIILVDTRSLGESIAIAGVPFNLIYFSDRAPGRYAESTVHIPLYDTNPLVTAIQLQGTYADGRAFSGSFSSILGQRYTFQWDNLDSLGHPLMGSSDLEFQVIYTIYGKQVPVLYQKKIGGWKTAHMKMGGWQPDIYHFYDFKRNSLVSALGSTQNIDGEWRGSEFFVTGWNVEEIYVFDSAGRHLKTLYGLTGALKYQFHHDVEGLITSIEDGFGQITTFQRDPITKLVHSIVAPKGQITTLEYSKSQYLTQVRNPTDEVYSMTYHGISGLLASFTKPEGELSRFTYDSLGMLVKDEHSGGMFSKLRQEFDTTWYSIKRVILENAAGRTETREITNSGSDSNAREVDFGVEAYTRLSPSEQTYNQYTASVFLHKSFRADSRFPKSKYVSRTVASYGGKSLVSDISRTSTLSDPADPFSVTSFLETIKTSNTVSQTSYDGLGNWTQTSPEGRISTKSTNPQGQVLRTQRAMLAPIHYFYQNDSRLKYVDVGDRRTEFAYDSYGFLSSVIDPIGAQKRYTHDALGKIKSETTPDGRRTEYSYDKNGRLVSMTLPHGKVHKFFYNELELLKKYEPPTSSGNGATEYFYNLDKTLSKVKLADGREVNYQRHPQHAQIQRIYSSDFDKQYTYGNFPINVPTNLSVTNTLSNTEYSLQRNYLTDSLLKEEFGRGREEAFRYWLTYSYDDLYRKKAINLMDSYANQMNVARYNYDKDNLITQAGNMEIRRDSATGQIVSKKLFNTEVRYEYDQYSALKKISYFYNAKDIYVREYKRDKLGRIVEENDGQAQSIFYDRGGRLLGRSYKATGKPISNYIYDKNGNRISSEENGIVSTATYDDQDRLLSFGSNTYGYGANGELTSKVNASLALTQYAYDANGMLVSVSSPGNLVQYGIDPEGRRVEKKVNGNTTAQFIWDGDLKLVAIENANGEVVKRFIYADEHSPEYMNYQGYNYLLIKDHKGSVIGALNASTGQLSQSINYSEWGVVLTDSNPGFQPFGFAGGLYDTATKTLRFGAREYDPEIGRWTSRDPIGFAGGDTNLYGYVLNDPINWNDPTGLQVVVSIPPASSAPYRPIGHPIGPPSDQGPLDPKDWTDWNRDLYPPPFGSPEKSPLPVPPKAPPVGCIIRPGDCPPQPPLPPPNMCPK